MPILVGECPLILSITHAVCWAEDPYILVCILLLKTHLWSEKASNDSMTAMENSSEDINRMFQSKIQIAKEVDGPYQRPLKSNLRYRKQRCFPQTKTWHKAPECNSGYLGTCRSSRRKRKRDFLEFVETAGKQGCYSYRSRNQREGIGGSFLTSSMFPGIHCRLNSMSFS
jgi:hypothetical protein